MTKFNNGKNTNGEFYQLVMFTITKHINGKFKIYQWQKIPIANIKNKYHMIQMATDIVTKKYICYKVFGFCFTLTQDTKHEDIFFCVVGIKHFGRSNMRRNFFFVFCMTFMKTQVRDNILL